ncbi:hypothetical protein R6Q57_020546 [Mikania cordata]
MAEAYERWEIKWHSDNKEILEFSKGHEIYSAMAKKEIINIISKGILLENDKLEIIRALQHATLYLKQEDDGWFKSL